MTSLSQFCKEYGLAKSTVHKACQDKGIPTSNGLNDDDVATLKEHFGVNDKETQIELSSTRRMIPTPYGSIEIPDLVGDLPAYTQALNTDTENTRAISQNAAQRFAEALYMKGLVDGVQLKADLANTPEALKNTYLAGLGGGLNGQQEPPKK